MRSPSEPAREPALSEPKPTPPLLAALAPLRVAARRRAIVLRPAVPLDVSLKGLDGLGGGRLEGAVGRDVEAGAPQQLLQLAHVSPADACAQGARAERRGRRGFGDSPDGRHDRGHGEQRERGYEDSTPAAGHDS
jgi:hypothetical protein